jgi:hypothetical protein
MVLVSVKQDALGDRQSRVLPTPLSKLVARKQRWPDVCAVSPLLKKTMSSVGAAEVAPECGMICLASERFPRLVSAAMLSAIVHCLDTDALASVASQIRFRFTINTTTTPTSTHINTRSK